MPDKISEELQQTLRDIVTSCEKEDDELRDVQIRQWQKNEKFWHGLQNIFWSERDESWISSTDTNWFNNLSEDDRESFGSFAGLIIDIFKAHGESIISALSAQIPSIRFVPDDADSTDDVLAAKTYNKVVDLLYRHNNAKLIFIRALFYLYIQGFVASYRYKDTDKNYGTYEIPEYESQEQVTQDPDTGEEIKQSIPVQTGSKTVPKSRAKLDVFGPLHVKVPGSAMKQEECGYLLLFKDPHKSEVKSIFPDLEEDIDAEGLTDSDRLISGGLADTNTSKTLVTVTQAWIRPSRYYEVPKEKRSELERSFPDGCHVTFIGKNKLFAEAINENLDDRWAIGKAGLSTYIHADPLCRPLVPIQEARNTLVTLTMNTIRHGIPSDFADPTVLNFDEYGQREAAPGYIYQAKTRGNQPLSNFFYSSNRATLSKEIPMFQKSLDQDAQFATGSFPSIYGGPSQGNSRTFSEYAASRQMALQRLSIAWMFITDWWQRTMEGLVRMYVGMVVDDEHFVKGDSGSYVNVWIRRTDLNGKVGGVEPEGSDAFPVSLIQKRDMVQKLIELDNEYINEALYTPENVRVIQDVLAFNELKIPGEADRIKQVIEIGELIIAEPVPDPSLPWGFRPSVMTEPDIDDEEVHEITLKNYLKSIEGLDLRRTNPTGYLNCRAHLKLHQMSLQMKLDASDAVASETSNENIQNQQ